MASILRKQTVSPVSSAAVVAEIMTLPENDSDQEIQPITAVATKSRSESAPLQDIFARVFNALTHFAPEGSFMIGKCSTMSHLCRIEFASAEFSVMRNQSLDISRGPMAEILTDLVPVRFCDGNILAESDIGLSRLSNHFESGHAAIFRIEFSDDTVAMIVYWQSDQFGPISPDRALALRTIAELTSQSASSQDLKVEVQALKLLLQNVRAEIGDSRRFYSHFSDAISQCFWVLNIDSGQTLVVSDNFERVWGASRKILADGLTGFMSTVFPADRDRVLSDFHLNLGIAMETELRVIAADGEVRWIRLRAFPDTNEVLSPQSTNNAISQNGRRIVLIADDITTKRAEDETVRNREAELISRARMIAVGDLAAGVAHEINNPLTIIVGKAMDIKRLVRDPKPDAKLIQELVEKIQKTSLRIADIVSSLKSLSRKEKNLSCQTTSFTKVFTELRDLCTERLKARGVRFQIETKTEQLTAEINSTQISQALLYLIDNGLDAIENDKEKWITIDSTEDKDSIFIYVTDSGPGIPVKNRGRIFDPFFTTKEPGKGTGLGLSLASSIVTRHGGSLSLDTMNSRTRFVLQLPKKQQRRPT